MARVTWILEADVFPQSHVEMSQAVQAAGCGLLEWNDQWLTGGQPPELRDSAVVFHGSLGNAAAIGSRFAWRPGAFCDTERFQCSSWYPQAREFLLHEAWRILPASEFVASARAVADSLGAADSVFVRPDSPLKPFSGRVLPVETVSLRALDYGFYFEDEHLPVVVAPVRTITREWRYVVVNGAVIAGSAYEAARRTALSDTPAGATWQFAERVARAIAAPEAVYVLDICEADDRLHLLELNPFSGADLYSCDRNAVVAAVSNLAGQTAD